jgi:hypothetical protein
MRRVESVTRPIVQTRLQTEELMTSRITNGRMDDIIQRIDDTNPFSFSGMGRVSGNSFGSLRTNLQTEEPSVTPQLLEARLEEN